MIRIILSSAIAIYLVFISCNLQKRMPPEQTEYFEGEIEYTFTYESLNQDLNTEDISSISTDKRIQRFKNGNYVSENYKKGKLSSRTWFDRSSNRVYIKITGSDTLYFYDTRNVDFILEPFELTDGEEILGYSTKKVMLNFQGKDSSNYVKNDSQYIFYIAMDLRVNPDWYTNFLEFDFNKIFAAAPGTILKEEDVISGIRKTTRTATRIKHKSVDLDLSVDTTKTLIEI